jgi:uncharacterized protein (TIGR03086 family)
MDALALADTHFDQVIRRVTIDDLDRPTPCPGWSVRDLLHHVVGGNRMSVVLIEGGSAEDAMAVRNDDLLGDDFLLAYEDSVADSRTAFAECTSLEQTVHHPMGDIPAAQLLGYRITDLTLHGWDLARAIGVDDTIDDALADHVLASLLPMSQVIARVGVFGEGPSGNVGDDAPVQARLLDLSGRRP